MLLGEKMKKILLLLLILTIALPAFCADVKNEKQKKDETVLRAIINSDSGRLSKHQTSFREDYYLYRHKDKNSVFAQIVALEKKYSKKDDASSKLNSDYLAKAKALYLYLAEYPSDKAVSTEFVKEFNSKLIIISDYDYVKLDDDITMLIALINVYK